MAKRKPITQCSAGEWRSSYGIPRIAELEEALRALIEDAEDMRSYVPEIFQEKWGHKEAIDKARAALHPKEGQLYEDAQASMAERETGGQPTPRAALHRKATRGGSCTACRFKMTGVATASSGSRRPEPG